MSNNGDMINFVCTSPCSIISLTVAMETMHFFHSAIEFIFEDKNSLHFWGPRDLAPMKNRPGGASN